MNHERSRTKPKVPLDEQLETLKTDELRQRFHASREKLSSEGHSCGEDLVHWQDLPLAI